MKPRINQIEKRMPTREQIAQRAYEIYLARGGQPGRDHDDWIQAEYELLQLPIREIASATIPARKAAKGKKIVAKAVTASALVILVQSALMFVL